MSNKRENTGTSQRDSISLSECATLAGGCFWCTEAVFLSLEGVIDVKPGYIGGKTVAPTYKEICTGETGHAEAVQVVFDPGKISFQEILTVFFATHDPTTLNRQGNDIGTQYRSAIFYHSEQQRQAAESYIQLLTEAGTYGKPIVTQLTEATHFYEAEEYHLNYFRRNTSQGYCQYVIVPKLEKLEKLFASKLKK